MKTFNVLVPHWLLSLEIASFFFVRCQLSLKISNLFVGRCQLSLQIRSLLFVGCHFPWQIGKLLVSTRPLSLQSCNLLVSRCHLSLPWDQYLFSALLAASCPCRSVTGWFLPTRCPFRTVAFRLDAACCLSRSVTSSFSLSVVLLDQ